MLGAKGTLFVKRRILALVLNIGLTGTALAQHDHGAMEHKIATQAKLEVSDDGRRLLAVRLGPLELPAKSDHMAVAQPAPQFLEIPFDGWITAYHPQLVDAQGNRLANRMLHHVAFWNTGRSDFLCPNEEEHIFGAGGEMNDWPALDGVGYRVQKGDRIRITSMFHNPTETSYPEAYLQVVMEYLQRRDGELRSAYPAWFDASECGNSGYDLPAGASSKTSEFRLNYTGTLLGVGGHLHDYGRRLVLENTSRKEPVAALDARLNPEGHILEMPIARFGHGYALKKGELMKVTASYENPGEAMPQGAMGIVVGYFLPEKDKAMKSLAGREPSIGPVVSTGPSLPADAIIYKFDKGTKPPGVTPPRIMKLVDPEYSERARRDRVQGIVVLRVVVGTDGRTYNIRVERTTPQELEELVGEAVSAVSKWRFHPGLKDGQPVNVEVTVEVNFRLG